MNTTSHGVLTAAILGFAMATAGCGEAAEAADRKAVWASPSYGDAFSQVWHDGRAELASYELTHPRYGQMREGTAVAITVTEPFNLEQGVKADAAGADTVNVLKLNLAEDYQTGVYDYNQMTSVFVATEPTGMLPAGSAAKVSFSAQEWCGHAYQQVRFGESARSRKPLYSDTSHSYFEGEADQVHHLKDMPAGGISEDALLLWARGLAGPRLEPGGSVTLPVYRSLAVQRLQHVAPAWEQATLTRPDRRETVKVPAGSFEAEVFKAQVGGREYLFYIDTVGNGNRRLVKLTRNDGYELRLVGVERMPYWQLNAEGDESRLGPLGLGVGGRLDAAE